MVRPAARTLALGGFLLLAAAGCASTDWRERYLEKERDASDLSGQLSDARAAHAAAVTQLEEAKARVAAMETENAALETEAPAVVTAPGDDGLAKARKDLEEKLGGAGKVEVTPDGNLAIALPSDITFGPGSRDLTAQGRKSVDIVAKEVVDRFAGYAIRIEGHTDSDPIKKSNFADNFELGAERALSVLRHMVKNHKIEPERLIAASRGDTQPVADNKSAGGKAKNRRVEIVILVPRDAAAAQSK